MACAYSILTPGSSHHNDLQAINEHAKQQSIQMAKTPQLASSIFTSVLAGHLSVSSMPHKFPTLYSNFRSTIFFKKGKRKNKKREDMPAKHRSASAVKEADGGLRARPSNGEIIVAHVDHIELLSFVYPIPIRTHTRSEYISQFNYACQ